MNPAAARVSILIVELLVFFLVTAFTSQFISHASAIKPAPGEAPPPQFPVLVYQGDRAKPVPSGYRVMPWSEWELLAQRSADASLLLPERAGLVKTGDSEASFSATEESGSGQSVELKWRTDGRRRRLRRRPVDRPRAAAALGGGARAARASLKAEG
jgi:hypothetical protein